MTCFAYANLNIQDIGLIPVRHSSVSRCTMNATTVESANPGSSADTASYTKILVLSTLPFFVTYIFTLLGNKGYEDGNTVREPPRVPYWIPFVGNTFGFAYDTERFLASVM